jgi:hypothetical protein
MLGTAVVLGVGLPAGRAAGDVIQPPGACVGSGTWEKAGFTETSTAHQPSDTIKVPRADTVKWQGNERSFQLGSVGPRRPIEGKVEIELPIGTATIESWGRTSVRYANQGEHKYNLPSVLIGVKMKLKGFHNDAGRLTCSGSVYVRVKGGAAKNPAAAAGAAGLVVSGGVLLFAGRPVFKKLWAFEDINPG